MNKYKLTLDGLKELPGFDESLCRIDTQYGRDLYLDLNFEAGCFLYPQSARWAESQGIKVEVYLYDRTSRGYFGHCEREIEIDVTLGEEKDHRRKCFEGLDIEFGWTVVYAWKWVSTVNKEEKDE